MNKELEKVLYESSEELFIDEIFEKLNITTVEEQKNNYKKKWIIIMLY